MELPAITLPKIDIPFDIPVLLHPAVDHFAIALPVIILLLELINLVARKRAISMVSLSFIILTVLAVVAAYFTGGVDAKEAFDTLGKAAQAELAEHKLLGTYLVIASALLLIFKLFSMMIGRALVQALYLLILVVFVAGMLKQGKEGGELVYEHGANVEKVKILDDKIFDLEEALDEATPKIEVPVETNKIEPAPVVPAAMEVPVIIPVPATVPVPKAVPAESTSIESVKTELKEEVAPTVDDELESVEGTEIQKSTIAPVKTVPAVTAAIAAPKAIPAAVAAPKAIPVTVSVPKAVPAPSIPVQPELKEEVVPAINEKVDRLEVEGMPEEMVQPKIDTH